MEKLDTKSINKTIHILAFLVFVLLLIWVVFFKGVGLNINSIKIKEIIDSAISQNALERINEQFDNIANFHANYVYDLVFNTLIFVPFGIFLPILYKDKISNNLFIAFGVSLMIEILQFFSALGSFECIDIFMNSLGFILGLLIYKLLKKLNNKTRNNLCIICLFLMVPLTIFAYAEIIINFDIFMPCFSIKNFNNLINI